MGWNFFTLAVGGLAFYLLILLVMYFGQRHLMYYPNAQRPVPEAYGLPGMQTVSIPVGDDISLYAWWQAPKGKHPVIVYFHGNAGNISDRAYKLAQFHAAGFGILLLSYRYNAGSGGTPSEQALISDGLSALDWLAEKGITGAEIILYGESLGSGVAVALAAQRQIAKLVLEAPYSTVAEVAQATYWFLPAYWLVKDRFDSLERISAVSAPLLVVHGDQDRIIPIRFARRLFEKADPKISRFVEISGGGHVDLYDYGMGEIVWKFVMEKP